MSYSISTTKMAKRVCLAMFVSSTLAIFLMTLVSLYPHTVLLESNEDCPRQSFSVGINLATSYGTIAVDFGNGTVWTHAVDGEWPYIEAMARLSSKDSMHPAPPYENLREQVSDFWRKLKRSWRKKSGQPASPEVEALAMVTGRLIQRAEERFALKIAYAAVSVPHFWALYQDDVNDVMEYIGVKYLHYGDGKPLFYETRAAAAGYGFSICKNYRDEEQCEDEEAEIPHRLVLTVHYAPIGLVMETSLIRVGSEVEDLVVGRFVDFSLGSNYEDNEDGRPALGYWRQLDIQLSEFFEERHGIWYVDTLVLLGGPAYTKFKSRFAQFLLWHLQRQQDLPDEIYGDDPMFAAAKGTAETMKRYLPDENFDPGSISKKAAFELK